MSNNLNKKLLDTSSSSQRNRILDWFSNIKPRLNTIEARDQLAIMSPASRILELRRKGYRITLHWIDEIDPLGVKHRIAQYVYMGRNEDEKENLK